MYQSGMMISVLRRMNAGFMQTTFTTKFGDTILILALGLVAFVFDTIGGVVFAKFLNLFLPKDKKISEVLPDSFWKTNFWLYWQTMFALQKWSSALEMKRYLCRYCHHIDGLPDFTALRFTKYNQYESMILPLVKYLENHGVVVEYGFDVKNVIIRDIGGKKTAEQIVYEKNGKKEVIDLTVDDLVFITNGCCTDTSCYGDQNTAPDLSNVRNGQGESWDLWKNIAAQAKHGEYGNPDKFCSDVDYVKYIPEGKYDLIIVDPPAFAKHRGARDNALRAYQRLNAAAISKVASGGLVFTYSCSQVVDKEAFALAVFSAAAQTGRSVRILDRLNQPADHAVNIYHPEGEYLKGLLLYVE